MKPSLTVSVNLQTRRALYTPSIYNAIKYKLDANVPVEVDVFGLFQVRQDYEDIDAYFVVKLPDGHCCYAGVPNIQFLPEEGADEQ